MQWEIVIRYDQQYIHLKADMIYRSDQVERFKVIGKNRSIVLQNNRPLLRARGLRTKRIDWKLVEGELHNSHVLQAIIIKLEKYLKMQSNSSI